MIRPLFLRIISYGLMVSREGKFRAFYALTTIPAQLHCFDTCFYSYYMIYIFLPFQYGVAPVVGSPHSKGNMVSAFRGLRDCYCED